MSIVLPVVFVLADDVGVLELLPHAASATTLTATKHAVKALVRNLILLLSPSRAAEAPDYAPGPLAARRSAA